MKYLGKAEGVTKRGRIKNPEIRRKLKVTSITKKIEEIKMRQFGHMCTMNSERQRKKIWEARTRGKRPRGDDRLPLNRTTGRLYEEGEE